MCIQRLDGENPEPESPEEVDLEAETQVERRLSLVERGVRDLNRLRTVEAENAYNQELARDRELEERIVSVEMRRMALERRRADIRKQHRNIREREEKLVLQRASISARRQRIHESRVSYI